VLVSLPDDLVAVDRLLADQRTQAESSMMSTVGDV
jgi:hypothetical protein